MPAEVLAMTRVSFLVDGFNLYHSLHQAMLDLGGVGTKWLDLWAICDRLLYQIGGNARTESIHYFSAPPTHVELEKPGAIARHQAYMRALRARGVVVELGKFKMKRRACKSCGGEILSHEEKETDVAIAGSSGGDAELS